jgi:hypothetical protein
MIAAHMRLVLPVVLAAGLAAAERPDVSPILDAIDQIRKLRNVTCTYLVQRPWAGNRVVQLRLDATIRDPGAHRISWSAWPTTDPLPKDALAGERADKDCDDPRIRGMKIASTRNQHQVLDEATGQMTVWSFAPFVLAKGIPANDARIAGYFSIAEGYGFDLPWLSPVSAVDAVASNPNSVSHGLIGLFVLAIAPADVKRAITDLCAERKVLPDGRIALRMESKSADISQWHVLRRNPDCGDSWVVDEIRYNANQKDYEAAPWIRSYTYQPVAIDGKMVPLLSSAKFNLDKPQSLTWDQVLLASYRVDDKLRDADVAIDPTEAKRVFDRAVGMEREK